MRISVLSVGRRMPAWVDAGFGEYAKRMPRECSLNLLEIDPVTRGKGVTTARASALECQRLLKALPKGARVIALDVRGHSWDTEELTSRLRRWMMDGKDLALLVGGADGLSEDCLARAEQRWSLSPLTFPHQLVRVMLAEQLYRAWTVLHGHPYHRA